ncbi:translocation/assembly module TamB domain-containing protein [Legionella sp.]|uniref:translocation/assembly module TamB domain-containing protein n=1 Tax=Legionella sp. TaxID=459 RepID=UPI000CA91005|nr:translocation/assembly module TamB domain-containing protein [Legionella sp.]PJE16609.1 MAG: hypothetical protein CK430_02975 [Legionella sp.]
MMRNLGTALKLSIKSLAILFILFIAFFLFLLTTKSGFLLSTKLAKIISPGELTIENPQGKLINHFSFSRLHYQDDHSQVDLKEFMITWQWKSLFHHQLLIESLHAKNLSLFLKNKEEKLTKTSAFKLPIDIKINDASIDKIQITHNENKYQISNLMLQAELTNRLWKVNKLFLNFNNMDFSLDGQVQPKFPYPISAQLQVKSTNSKQNIQGFIKLGGDFSLYHWHGEMINPKGTLINGTLRYGKEIHNQATWHQFIWPLDKDQMLEIPEGNLHLDGTIPNINLTLVASVISPIPADIQLVGKTSQQTIHSQGTIKLARGEINLDFAYDEKTNPKIQGKIQAKGFDVKIAEQPFEQLKLDTELTGDSFPNLVINSLLTTQYFGNLLTANLHYQNRQIQAQATLGTNQIQIQGSLPYQWKLKAIIPKPDLLHPSLKSLQTELRANATIASPTNGELKLMILPGNFQLDEKNSTEVLKFSGGEFYAQLTPSRLNIIGNLTLDKYKSLALTLDLPKFRLDQGLSEKQALKGKLSLEVNSLAFLEQFSSVASKIEGQLNALINLSGTISKPLMEGTLNLDKAKLAIPKLGLNLAPIQINLQSRNKRWTTQGSFTSQGRVLSLKGSGDFTPEMTGSLKLNGDDFPLINTAEYVINLSPQLVIYVKPNAIDMTGQILIPNAQIKPQTFTSTTSLSEDAVFVGAKSTPNPFHINTDLRLAMGENVVIDMKGLHGFLDGSIRLLQLPQGPLNASGELTIRDGKYKAYGQDLTIDQGQLIFTGGSIDNPGISVRAIRRFNNKNASFTGSNQLFDFKSANIQNLDFSREMIVGVEVSGRLSATKIKLFSDPSTLSQADILSMLLLGKPANQANQAGGQLLLNAISSMNLGAGTKGAQLLSQLKQSLGVDLNIKSNTKYNQQTNEITESDTVVVGKSVTKRIYVSYNFGLAQADSNVFTLTYLLNKFFSIQVNASATASGIDLLYTRDAAKDSKPRS